MVDIGSQPYSVSDANPDAVSSTDALDVDDIEYQDSEDVSETLGSQDTQYFQDPSGVVFGCRGDYVFVSRDPRKRKHGD